MKTTLLALALVFIMMAMAEAAERTTLKNDSWLCTTPEAYDQAIAEEQKVQVKDRDALKQKLLDEKLCMHADGDFLEDIMAPFVQVLDRRGDKVKVTFMVEFYKRVEYLHRRFSRVNYTGWTAVGNLTELAFVGR